MADLIFNDGGVPYDLTLSDLHNIGTNDSRYRILVVDTQSDQPRMLPINVLNQRFLYKNENDTTNFNLTAKNLITSNSLVLRTNNNQVTLTVGKWDNVQNAGSQRLNTDAWTDNRYINIDGGICVNKVSVFKNTVAFTTGSRDTTSLSFLEDYVNSNVRSNLLIGSYASRVDNNIEPVISSEVKGTGSLYNPGSTTTINSAGISVTRESSDDAPSFSARLGIIKVPNLGTQGGVDSYYRPGIDIYYSGSNAGDPLYNIPVPYRFIYPGINQGNVDLVTQITNGSNVEYYRANLSTILPSTVPVPTPTIPQTVSGDNTFTPSDDRLKTRTSYPEYTLDQLVSIPVFEFYYNADETKKLHLGTSAQSLRKVEPLLVHGEESEDEYLSVDYDKIGLLALKGMQMLKKENDELRNEVNELKELVKQLINK